MKFSHLPALLLGVTSLAACTSIHAQVQHYSIGDGLPFSEAVQVGDMLYLSGQIGVVPESNELVAGGIESQARQAMENIGSILARRGLKHDALVKCTVMLADMADWPAFNKIYVQYFKPGRLPARSAFGGMELAYDGRLEIECWAHNPRERGATTDRD